MLGLQYTTPIMNNLREFHPKDYREMQKNGTLNDYVQKQSKQAAEQVASLMSKGLQRHEAEEMVLPDYLLPEGRNG
jgi:hypothetical protein